MPEGIEGRIPFRGPLSAGRPPARRRAALGHGLRRARATIAAAAAGAARADHRGRAQGEPPARRHDDRRGAQLRRAADRRSTAGPPVRDLVEIGMGREARRSYDLTQVEIVPSRRTRSSQEVSTAWQLDAYRFDDPAGHPPDRRRGVAGERGRAIGQLGGLAVLNAEGLWARHADAERRARPGRRGRRRTTTRPRPCGCCRSCTPRRSTPGCSPRRCKQVREAGVTVAARVSPQRARELTPGPARRGRRDPGRAGHDHLRRARVAAASRSTSRTFIAALDVPVVAGGVRRLPHRHAPHAHRRGRA